MKVIPYSSKYPQIFQAIKGHILDLIPYKIEVEHIGSTAVSGLGGRNIIDILILTKREHLEFYLLLCNKATETMQLDFSFEVSQATSSLLDT